MDAAANIQEAKDISEYVLPYILTILGTVTTVLLMILLKKLGKIDGLSTKLNDHVLTFTTTVANLVTIPLCKETRGTCLELNRKIIQEPLEERINNHLEESEERWKRQDQEAEEIWAAVRSHEHTDKGVVITPRRIL